MLPNQQQWDEFYGAMRRKTGLDLSQYKANQLQRRILSMADSRGAKTLTEFWAFVGASADNITWFMDKLAINVSELFRNPEKWVELEKKVIPELLQTSRTLKCWSAGSSYGAEAYTLATILSARFKGAHTVLGTDIDEAALKQATAGEFNDQDMRGVPKEFASYFRKEADGKWHADAALKRIVRFQRGNLLQDRFESGFDLILCRNVVIYFTEEAKSNLYRRFFEALRPGGVLFVGSTERIVDSREIGFDTAFPFFYRKPSVRDQAWRNAS